METKHNLVSIKAVECFEETSNGSYEDKGEGEVGRGGGEKENYFELYGQEN